MVEWGRKMQWLIAFVVVVWLLSRGLTAAGKALEKWDRKRAAENEAQDLAAAEAAQALGRIADAVEGPPPTPVSERIERAKEGLSRRHKVREAMARELGVK